MKKSNLLLAAAISIIIFAVILYAQSHLNPDFLQKMSVSVDARHTESGVKSGGWLGVDADSIHSWDALHYHIDMELFPTTHEVSASVMITGECKEQGLTEVPMHFTQGMTITSLTVNGSLTSYSWIDDNLTVDLDAAHSIGDTFEIEIGYNGTPSFISSPNSLGNMGLFWGNTIYTYTDPEGARPP